MDTPLSDTPNAEYSRRLQSERLKLAAFEHRHSQLGTAKLVAAFATLAVFVWGLESRAVSIVWCVVPAVAFILLEIAHVRLLRSLKRCSRTIAFYERGLARLENRWMGTGETGEAFEEASHPYSRDLDLFGRASLFEFLCTARTGTGQQILAQWLLYPSALEEIQRRQAAVTELRPQLDLREEMAIFGEDWRSGVRPEALTAWAEAEPVLKVKSARIVAMALAALWLASVGAWAIGGLWALVLAASVLSLAFSFRLRARVRAIVPAEKFAPDLKLVAGVLAHLEQEKFSAARLVELQSGLHSAMGGRGTPPSLAIGRVSGLIESMESRRNPLVAFVDPFVHWTTQTALAIEDWRQRFGPSVRHWLNAVGEMEALTALASYAYEHPADIFPEFADGHALFQAEGLTHPLLPEGQAVRNDLNIGAEMPLIIISGPNMAGKSTLIRAIGINAVLAQCGAPVRARRLRLSRLQVTASICVLDSLQGGISRFYAEIRRLKLVTELTRARLPVLFLLDELLSGTNSQDQRIGAEAVVKSLVAAGAVGLVTTHDLALALIADGIEPRGANFHFEDRLEDGELHFDYRLTPGVSKTSNALTLMRSIGLEI